MNKAIEFEDCYPDPEKYKEFKDNWSWTEETERWLRRMIIGKSLHLFCGQSKVGDVRVDLKGGDGVIQEDVFVYLKKCKKEGIYFDTIIADPPFNYYFKFAWIVDIANICRRRIILSTPLVCVKLPKSVWKKRIFSMEDGMFMRIFQVFDRVVGKLE